MARRSKEERAAKVGTVKAAERDRVRQDAQQFLSARDAEQWPLFNLVQPGEQLPDDDKPAGPGRPVGARTASPLEYRRYILSVHGDFLSRFVRLAQADTLALAKLLQCKPLEALAIQQKLGATAAPYVYTPQKAPIDAEDAAYFAGMMFVAGAAGAGQRQIQQGTDSALAALAGAPPDIVDLQAVRVDGNAGSEPAHSEPGAEEEEQAP